VPDSSIQQIEGKPVVFVRNSDTEFRKREIQVGMVSGGYTEVRSGIKAGEYEFHTPMLPLEVLSALAKGQVKRHLVTIPEGFTLTQIAQLLENLNLVEKKDFLEYTYVAERICGICGYMHGWGYCHTVEQVMGIEVPERAQYLRTIWGELSRINSHLLWLGVAADAMGFESLFMQFCACGNGSWTSARPAVSSGFQPRTLRS
jgi:hypothetical protein